MTKQHGQGQRVQTLLKKQVRVGSVRLAITSGIVFVVGAACIRSSSAQQENDSVLLAIKRGI